MQVAAPRVIFEGVRSDGLPWRVHVTGQVCVWRRGRDGRARVGLGSLKAARGVKAKKGREREDVTINGAGGVFMEKYRKMLGRRASKCGDNSKSGARLAVSSELRMFVGFASVLLFTKRKRSVRPKGLCM